jgi:type IV pilus assembly protein PilA
LKGIFTGQKSRFGERDRYSSNTGEVGFQPERGNRYYYDLGDLNGTGAACANFEDRVAAVPANAPPYCGVQADQTRFGTMFTNAALASAITGGATPTFVMTNSNANLAGVGFILANCPNCDFSAQAVGNVDNDAVGDVQWVSSQIIEIAATMCSEEQSVAMNTAVPPGGNALTLNDVTCDN